MKKREFLIVNFWNKFREEKPSLLKVFYRQPPLFLVLSLGSPILFWLLYYLTSDGVWLIVFFMGVGALLRDIGFALRIARDWPHMKKHLDWNQIDETLAKYRDE